MSRRIITTQYQAAGGSDEIDTYNDRIIKYIPSDIIAAWVAVTGLVAGATDVPASPVLWTGFVTATILTALWTHKQTAAAGQRPAWTQIAVSTSSFIVWVFALGGPFVTLSLYEPLYGSLALIFYSLLVGLIVPRE